MTSVVARPDVNEQCASCNHAFGMHYKTYGAVGRGDLTSYGCAGVVTEVQLQSDDLRHMQCDCRGFMIRYTGE